MNTIAAFFAIGLVSYAAIGCVVGAAFVLFGVTAVQAAPVTAGARILLLPAAATLWPLVLCRWLSSRRRA